MSDRPNLFVSGLGRCGTTMVMTMLDAGGFPVTGPRPSYEPAERWRGGRPDMDWLPAQGGRAVKWIDPTHHFTLPGRLTQRPVIILMERNPREQARSQVKLLSMTGMKGLGRRAEKAIERSIKKDVPPMRAHLRNSAIVYGIDFEDILENPFWAARKLGRLVAHHYGADFDDEVAARVVIPRHPSCAPDLSMETTILPMIAAELNLTTATLIAAHHGGNHE